MSYVCERALQPLLLLLKGLKEYHLSLDMYALNFIRLTTMENCLQLQQNHGQHARSPTGISPPYKFCCALLES